MDTKVEFVLTANVNHKTGVVTIEHFHVDGEFWMLRVLLFPHLKRLGIV